MYKIVVAPRAKRDIKRLDRSNQRRVVRALEKLKRSPRAPGIEKLSRSGRFWRMRVGDHRIVFMIADDDRVVVVLIVRHRREIYRDLDKLAATLQRIDIRSLVRDVE